METSSEILSENERVERRTARLLEMVVIDLDERFRSLKDLDDPDGGDDLLEEGSSFSFGFCHPSRSLGGERAGSDEAVDEHRRGLNFSSDLGEARMKRRKRLTPRRRKGECRRGLQRLEVRNKRKQ